MLLVYEIRKSNAVIEGQSNVFFSVFGWAVSGKE